jgi:hypothetical protein
MKTDTESNVAKRFANRISTEAAVTFMPFASSGENRVIADGVLCNFSSKGLYIETTDQYQSGAILIVRIVRYPKMPPSGTSKANPRSICLAEVRWLQELPGSKPRRFGIGLKYID